MSAIYEWNRFGNRLRIDLGIELNFDNVDGIDLGIEKVSVWESARFMLSIWESIWILTTSVWESAKVTRLMKSIWESRKC